MTAKEFIEFAQNNLSEIRKELKNKEKTENNSNSSLMAYTLLREVFEALELINLNRFISQDYQWLTELKNKYSHSLGSSNAETNLGGMAGAAYVIVQELIVNDCHGSNIRALQNRFNNPPHDTIPNSYYSTFSSIREEYEKEKKIIYGREAQKHTRRKDTESHRRDNKRSSN